MLNSFHESETLNKYQINLLSTRRKERSSLRPDPGLEVGEMEWKPTCGNSNNMIYQPALITSTEGMVTLKETSD